MSVNGQPNKIYYKSKDDLKINDLPYFFGWVEVRDGKISGRHYKPKFNKLTDSYSIGYYRIDGEEADFRQVFQSHGEPEITAEEFESILSQWTQDELCPPVSWGLGEIKEVASPQLAEG
jgi:hypothetical protein